MRTISCGVVPAGSFCISLTRWHRGRPLSEADAETLRAHLGGLNKTKLVIA
jgi:hypothetical protein